MSKAENAVRAGAASRVTGTGKAMITDQVLFAFWSSDFESGPAGSLSNL